MDSYREHVLRGRSPLGAYEDIVDWADATPDRAPWDVRAVVNYVFTYSRFCTWEQESTYRDEVWALIEEIVKAGREAK